MEWLELLKILSDQQANEVTQQQIDALSAAVRQIEQDQALFGLVLLLLVTGLILAIGLNHWSCIRRIKKLEGKLLRYEVNIINDVIRQFNSKEHTKSDVRS